MGTWLREFRARNIRQQPIVFVTMRAAAIFILFLLAYGNAWADAMPFKNKVEIWIDVQYDTSGGCRLDSTLLILMPNGRYDTSSDTLPEWSFHNEYGGGVKLSGIVDTLQTGFDTLEYFSWFRRRPFKLILVFNDKQVTTPVMEASHNASQFDVIVSGNNVKVQSHFFEIGLSAYLWYLFWTLVVELLLALFYFWRRHVPMIKLRAVVTANLISHPVLWTLCTYIVGFEWGQFLEIGVVAFEAWWIYRATKEYLSPWQCFRLSLVINLISWMFGLAFG